jgi:AraC family transcriptional regulator
MNSTAVNFSRMCGYFIGSPYATLDAGAFTLGHWVAEQVGTDVKPHGHERAHFMFAWGADYVSDAEGRPRPNEPVLIYNPAGVFHRDRFEKGPASFFTITLKEPQEPDMPQAPLHVNKQSSRAIVGRLMRETCKPATESSLIESLGYELLGTLSKGPPDSSPPRWLKRACEYIQDNKTDSIRIDQVSVEVGVHPVHLTRNFRRFLGVTPADYIRYKRLEGAFNTLTTTDEEVGAVAVASGYADQSQFTKEFKTHFGIPPGAFRRLNVRI